jgi:hypothetical protein
MLLLKVAICTLLRKVTIFAAAAVTLCNLVAPAHTAASTATMTKQAAAEKRLRERQAAGTRIPLYETQQQKVVTGGASGLQADVMCTAGCC